jgi:hypothetical protein
MHVRAILLLSALVLGGCGATGPKYSEIRNSIPQLNPEHGRIYFYRSSYVGGLVKPDIQLNGTVVGEMTPGGFFFVDRSPGTHTATASTEAEARLPFPLEANQTQYIRGYISLGIIVGRPNFELVDPKNAAVEISDLAYTGSMALQPGAAGAPTESAASPGGAAGAAGGSTQMKDLDGLLQDKGADKK